MRSCRLLPLLLLPLGACPPAVLDPIVTASEASTGTTGSTAVDSDGASSTPTSTGGPGDPDGSSTSGTVASSTSDAAGSSTTGDTGTTGTPAACGPPCDMQWVHDGDLIIDDDTDLSSLRCLVEVTGNLSLAIPGMTAPPAELANLRRIGLDLDIGWQFQLTSLAGLECLEFVGNTLSLPMNKSLADISALAGVQHIFGLRMWGSPQVTDLSLFDGVDGLRWIDLLNMSGVPRLPVVGPDTLLRELTLEGCDALTDLDALTGAPGDPAGITVSLIDDPKLTSIAGLADLWTGGVGLSLDNLPALESLAGLEGLAAGEGHALLLRRLPLVADVEPLAGLEVLTSLYLDDMPKLTTLAPLAGLREVQTLVLGSCRAEGGAGLDGVKTLAPLETLEYVSRLTIGRNDALVTLPALTLQFKPEVELIDNPSLSAVQTDAFMLEHGGCAQPPMMCQCSEDLPTP